MEIKKDFFIKGTAARPGIKLVPKFITIHNVGVKSTAEQGRSFFKRNSNKFCSTHFFVDDKEVIQMIPVTSLAEIAWHAGDGRFGRGNRESISIEICEVPDQNKANENAIKLCVELLKKFPYTPIVPHKYWINKNCPHLLLDSGSWNSFLGKIYSKL